MDLYIHFGLYKTGSSFLQTISARNRSILAAGGYFYPESSREDDTLAGKISPGNGNGIVGFLKDGDVGQCVKILQSHQNKAQKLGLDKIVISDEALIHAFASPKGLISLKEAIGILNFSGIYCLGYLRDPVGHCLSTYKHRAKKGSTPEFHIWLEEEYETMIVLEKFFNLYDSFPFNWNFQRYVKNSESMAVSFFTDWLQLSELPEVNSIHVNSSLSLSEIEIIRQLGKCNPRWVGPVQKGLNRISPKLKGTDFELEKYYSFLIYNSFKKWEQLINRMNIVLNNCGASHLEFIECFWDREPARNIFLSPVQLEAIFGILKKCDSIPYRIKYTIKTIYIRIKRGLKKII